MDNMKKAGADFGKKAAEIARKPREESREDQAGIQERVRPDNVTRDGGHESFDDKLKEAGLPDDIADEPKIARKTDEDTEVARQVTPNMNG